MFIFFSFLIIFFLCCIIYVTKACDSYYHYFFSRVYTNLISVAIYFCFVSSLLQFAPLHWVQVPLSPTEDRLIPFTAQPVMLIRQLSTSTNAVRPADHELTHYSLRRAQGTHDDVTSSFIHGKLTYISI
jgi:hypothetical protein